MGKNKKLKKSRLKSIFNDDLEFDCFLNSLPTLTEKEEKEKMERINKGCDLILKLGLKANIPEL